MPQKYRQIQCLECFKITKSNNIKRHYKMVHKIIIKDRLNAILPINKTSKTANNKIKITDQYRKVKKELKKLIDMIEYKS